jgi:hypothetical protein
MNNDVSFIKRSLDIGGDLTSKVVLLESVIDAARVFCRNANVKSRPTVILLEADGIDRPAFRGGSRQCLEEVEEWGG